MATLQQLQAMKTDVDETVTSVVTELTRIRTLVATIDALPASKRSNSSAVTRRLLADRAGHLDYLQTKYGVQSRFLAAEIVKVQGGGTSSVFVPTLPGDVSPRKSVQPVPRAA